QIAEFARWMAPFLPAGGVVLVLLSATRGFGTMIPTVTVDRLGRPFVQVALALGLIVLAGGHHANHGLIALSWAVPQLIGAIIAATRYITAGLMVGVAIQHVAGPKLSELMAQKSWERARGVYQTTTAWLMVATWPLYLTFALFAPTLLRVFGHGFKGGTGALE